MCQKALVKVILNSHLLLKRFHHVDLDSFQLVLSIFELLLHLSELTLKFFFVVSRLLRQVFQVFLRLHEVLQEILGVEATLEDLDVPLHDFKFPFQLLKSILQLYIFFRKLWLAACHQFELTLCVFKLGFIVGTKFLLSYGLT